MFLYRFYKNNAEKTFFDIHISVSVSEKDTCSFRLPSWRPGRYEIQNFAQNIRDFKPVDEHGSLLKYVKKDKDTWIVDTTNANKLELTYSYYARQMDAGGTWIDDTQWYINFITCAMLVDNQADVPCQVQLDIPDGWQIACSMENTTGGLLAQNFYELVDSPLIASPSIQHLDYKVQNTHFHLWFQGDIVLEEERIIKDFKHFTEIQIELFGSFPTENYHFLFQILPYRHYHGVEHAHSTVITLGPYYDFYSEKMYNDFLGVSSHELFHTWNVTRLRPIEMVPYNFFSENYFNTGFIAEGITTYYGDYMLKKSGVFSMEQYLKELNTLCERHFGNIGKDHASLADSSVDLWLDGYKKGISGRKVSIYVKGALTALVLDLTLRLESSGKLSLDDVMRLIWRKYAKSGYVYQQYIDAVKEIAGRDLQDYFTNYIDGTVQLDKILSKLLPHFGFALQEKLDESLVSRNFGMKLKWHNGNLKVLDLAEDSPAIYHLEQGDEIVAVNHLRPTDKYESLFDANKVHLHYFSHGKLNEVSINVDGKSYFTTYKITEDTSASDEVLKNKVNWLG